MGETPTTTNQVAQVANDIIAASNSVAVQLIEGMAIAEVPFLGLPVIRQIFGFILGWIDGFVSKAEQTGLTFVIIDTQTGGEESGLQQAKAALIAAQSSGDANAIKTAIQNYANAVSNLAHFDGSAPSV